MDNFNINYRMMYSLSFIPYSRMDLKHTHRGMCQRFYPRKRTGRLGYYNIGDAGRDKGIIRQNI